MAANYVLLEKITVGAAGASSVTFANIPQTGYTDLLVKFSARGDAGAISRSVGLTFNGSSTGYSNKFLQGDGATATSGSGTSIYLGECTAATATANTFANQEFYIPNYTSSNYKSLSVDSVAETNATTQYMSLVADLWANTAAITSMTFVIATGNFAQYSTFYLYGVAKLGTTPTIAPKATGGDTVMTDGTYWYHAFKSSGTFTPAVALSADVLVVAGGGGGGKSVGGGGGAGGLYYSASNSVTTTGYTVTIGAGGATSGGASGQGSNGSNSVFGSLTAAVGGGGGGGDLAGQYNGLSGGSGGAGGANSTTSSGTGGSATSGQGYAGGNGFAGSTYTGGGGGGAGAIGSNGAANAPGNGGAGVNTYSSWLSTTGLGVSGYIAGGGGGGANNGQTSTGGSGGGGYNGGAGTSYVGTAGTANTGGGGGGGAGGGAVGGTGGSGLVIVRYAV